MSTPSPGHQYLILNVTVKNLNEQDADIGNPNYFKLITADGFAYRTLLLHITSITQSNPCHTQAPATS